MGAFRSQRTMSLASVWVLHFKFRQMRVYPGNGGGSEQATDVCGASQADSHDDCGEDEEDDSPSALGGVSHGEKEVAVEELEDARDDDDSWRCRRCRDPKALSTAIGSP